MYRFFKRIFDLDLCNLCSIVGSEFQDNPPMIFPCIGREVIEMVDDPMMLEMDG